LKELIEKLMDLDESTLIAWGAVQKKYPKGFYLFREGDRARFYFQIVSGTVRMCNHDDEGREFIQGDFFKGDSFGEPPMILEDVYPADVYCLEDAIVLMLPRNIFFRLLMEYPEIMLSALRRLSERIMTKAHVNKMIMHPNPEERILDFLRRLKRQRSTQGNASVVPYTRQEIANFTCLRVETVIRAVKKMEAEGTVQLKQRKIHF
jgi:CRP-like cAMP-binding protein